AGGRADDDPILRELVAAETPEVAVVGKTWTLHVTNIVGTTLEEDMAMISHSVAFLKRQGREVIYDCEHFFDGFRADREYALATVKAAAAAGADWAARRGGGKAAAPAGADWVAMCDTNGGSLPGFIAEVVGVVRETIPTRLG